MKNYLFCLAAIPLLSACGSAPINEKDKEPAAGEWQVSTLSERTIAKANAAVRDYQTCLNETAMRRAADRGDPRAVADAILRACENRLAGVKTAYDAENVPPAISERYLRKTRSQGAQSLLRYVMAVHAMRAAEEEEAAKNHPTSLRESPF
jgi:hypothetical protein